MAISRLTGADYISRGRKAMGNPSTDDWSDAEILQVVQQAEVDVALRHRPPELRTSTDVTTSSGTATYELSVRPLWIEELAKNVTDGNKVKPTSWTSYMNQTQGTTAPQGTVYRYLVNGTGSNDRPQVSFLSTPNGTKTIRFWYGQFPTGVQANGVGGAAADTYSLLPQRHDNEILQHAIKLLLNEDQQRSQIQAQERAEGEAAGLAGRGGQGPPEHEFALQSRVAPSTKAGTRRKY